MDVSDQENPKKTLIASTESGLTSEIRITGTETD